MNYNDEILENRTFNIFKQILFDIVLAICILLAVALVFVYGFGFRPYEVLSDSMAPVFVTGDIIVVKSQDDYEVGDIIKYSLGSSETPVTHRLVAIFEDSGTKYYITHGDNVQSPNSADGSTPVSWEKVSEYLQSLKFSDIYSVSSNSKILSNIDVLKIASIEGKVVCTFANYGSYINFIAEHKVLFIAIVVAIWAISATVQNELEMRKSRRLFV